MNRDNEATGIGNDFEISLPILRVINKSWDDPAFKSRLLADPVKVLEEEGVNLPIDRPIFPHFSPPAMFWSC
jgi:hypothetical protein